MLSKALQEHPDQGAQPVFVYPQQDKLSQAWILATPSSSTHLPSVVFREHMVAHLCLPSPACQAKLDQQVGQDGAWLISLVTMFCVPTSPLTPGDKT